MGLGQARVGACRGWKRKQHTNTVVPVPKLFQLTGERSRNEVCGATLNGKSDSRRLVSKRGEASCCTNVRYNSVPDANFPPNRLTCPMPNIMLLPTSNVKPPRV